MKNLIDDGARLRGTRPTILTCVLFALLIGGSVAQAVAPPCEDVCTDTTLCKTRCSDGGGTTTTCGNYGVCNSGPAPCPTVQCAAGCAPKPDFTISSNPANTGRPVTFTANTSNINPATANWDLGDGYHEVGNDTVTHAYSSAGDYHVCLSANENVCDTVQAKCKWLTVKNQSTPPPPPNVQESEPSLQ